MNAEVLQQVVEAWDARTEAWAGRGHEGHHDREIHLASGWSHERGESCDTNCCSACAGAQYGTDSDMNDAIDAARSVLR